MRSLLILIILIPLFSLAQEDLDSNLMELDSEIRKADQTVKQLNDQRTELVLQIMRRDLMLKGLPATEPEEILIWHPGHVLVWNEPHEQPKWVAHVVDTVIREGFLARIDTFLPDPKVKTGTSSTPDYWFSGYDRGHMVPSADMRWNQDAMKATYYYSNVAPQHQDLNRGSWAEMEDWIRRYVNFSGNRVFVVTGPILEDALPTLQNEGRENEVSIPMTFYKVVADLDGEEPKGIAFIMSNGLNEKPVSDYATTIKEAEQLSGLDFFETLDDELEDRIESSYDPKLWVVEGDPNFGDVQPLKQPLPKGLFSTTQAKYHVGNEVTVCGTVVSSRPNTRGTALYLNFDKLYPNQDFYATIWGYNGPNFSYDPETWLLNKQVCVTGKVTMYNNVSRISVENEDAIRLFDEVK
jgi:endonuclease G